MAAMIGLGKRSILRITLLPKRMNVLDVAAREGRAQIGAAAEDPSPLPVMITARTLSSVCTELQRGVELADRASR